MQMTFSKHTSMHVHLHWSKCLHGENEEEEEKSECTREKIDCFHSGARSLEEMN
jgi:hypothetical protein